MKTICLPYFLSKTVKILSYFAVMLLDCIHFLLIPITWIQFKAHLFMMALAGGGYFYLKFALHHTNALPIAVLGFFGAVFSVALFKLMRKCLHRVRTSLIRIVYAPLGVCIRVHSSFFHLNQLKCKKIANSVTMD